ncbi:calcium calmodulin dependent protein kinase [Pyrenophora tritici-repentis]|nr:calcium calmodulin dependent protein kinase [Pyrenophora tritici-repentis]KAF7575222.1 calcium-calmodulin dependent protein kinase [Pyrenophora tritici-repentis]KAI0573494.1 calcium calmodulin dependent protein kinase [Pyrenophora tritici-repentis]KAI0577367.1 calcium calmodulin dependent protein kinase [Pyrenophora tritici-repentis]KAI0619494.1 calcium calmodulin dependent protein kinase [Pyrenophora tritici-repentis]
MYLQCIAGMTKMMILSHDTDDEKDIEALTFNVPQRQISFFADEGIFSIIKCLDEKENPWAFSFFTIVKSFSKDSLRRPFRNCLFNEPLDDEFVDITERMMRMDPRLRITAEEALAHPWFDDVV